MFTKQSELSSKQPHLIQRCTLGRKDRKLNYEYMGSSEYECGDQAKSLKRIFTGAMEIRKCEVRAFDRDVEFYLVARSDFDFSAYPAIIDGLIKQRWRTKEQTYLDLVLQKKFRLVKAKDYDFVETEAWFDFQNDVLFTLSQKDADFLVVALGRIKEIWRQKEVWLNSPPVKKFRKELEKIKTRLRKADKRWVYLDGIEEKDGKLMVWFNPMLQKTSCGFVSLQDLRDWLQDKGKITESYRREEQ